MHSQGYVHKKLYKRSGKQTLPIQKLLINKSMRKLPTGIGKVPSEENARVEMNVSVSN